MRIDKAVGSCLYFTFMVWIAIVPTQPFLWYVVAARIALGGLVHQNFSPFFRRQSLAARSWSWMIRMASSSVLSPS